MKEQKLDNGIKVNRDIDNNVTSIEGDRFYIGDGSIYSDNTNFDTRRYDWQPEKDITAYELAKCMPVVNCMQLTGNTLVSNTKNMVGELPKNCQRHFEIVE